MKQLIVVRHAKSSWADAGMQDFDRPLNNRGLNDAPIMAERLLAKGIHLQAILSSPANRALTTAAIFANKMEIPFQNIIQIPGLYHASSETLFSVAKQIEDNYHTVAIFTHNPGITSFVNQLSEKYIIDMPTCGVFAVKANVDSWQMLTPKSTTFHFFDYPKAG